MLSSHKKIAESDKSRREAEQIIGLVLEKTN
jgi:hypothetical protein